jgi:hypothetical protein
MIRNVVVHIINEQPLMADLYEMPKALDQGLLCTNLRTIDGKRPVFIDRVDAVFFFPYLHIRFLEIPTGSTGLPELEAPSAVDAQPDESDASEPDADIELDEDFLRRIREV